MNNRKHRQTYHKLFVLCLVPDYAHGDIHGKRAAESAEIHKRVFGNALFGVTALF